jgi:hypothetical protein
VISRYLGNTNMSRAREGLKPEGGKLLRFMVGAGLMHRRGCYYDVGSGSFRDTKPCPR